MQSEIEKFFFRSLSECVTKMGLNKGLLKDFNEVLELESVSGINKFCLLDTIANCEKKIESNKTSRDNTQKNLQTINLSSSNQIPSNILSPTQIHDKKSEIFSSQVLSLSEIKMTSNLPSDISYSSNNTIQTIMQSFSKTVKLTLSDGKTSNTLTLNDSTPDFMPLTNLDLYFKTIKGQVLMLCTSPAFISQPSFILSKNCEYKIESISFTVKITQKQLKILQIPKQNFTLDFNTSGKIYFNAEQKMLLECATNQEHDFEIIKSQNWEIKQNQHRPSKFLIFKSIKPSNLYQKLFFPISVSNHSQIQLQLHNSQFRVEIQDLA